MKNWSRLHELRMVQPGKVPTEGALRLEIEVAALGALAAALTGPALSGIPYGGRAGQH